jgi:hypothetical protein
MNPKVISVTPLDDHRLNVRFEDGVEGEVRLEPSHPLGAFAPLQDPEAFRAVSCAKGIVAWPGVVALPPQRLHDALMAQGVLQLN